MEVKHTPGPPADLRAVLHEARGYVAEAVGGYEHSEGRSLLARIDALLSSEALPIVAAGEPEAALSAPDTQITQPSHDDEGLIERLTRAAEVVNAWKEPGHVSLFEVAANTISRLKGERDDWDWLASRTNLELDWAEIDEGEAAWRIHRISGNRSDREWELIATGETPLEAVRKARAHLQGKPND